MAQTSTPHMTDYEAERRNFHLEVPEYFNFATDVIGKWASDPNKLAMLWIGQHGEEEHITYAHSRMVGERTGFDDARRRSYSLYNIADPQRYPVPCRDCRTCGIRYR